MVVLASLGYAARRLVPQARLLRLQPMGVVAGTMAASALMTLPFAAIKPPDEVPPLEALAALVVLGVLGTGVAFMLFYSLVASEGPAKASLVAYVAPGFAVVYGVLAARRGLHARHRRRAGADRRRLVAGGRGTRRPCAAGASPCQPPRAASWPQAASMSRPRVRRTVARTPALLERGLEGGDRLAGRAPEARVGRVVGDQVDLEGVCAAASSVGQRASPARSGR